MKRLTSGLGALNVEQSHFASHGCDFFVKYFRNFWLLLEGWNDDSPGSCSLRGCYYLTQSIIISGPCFSVIRIKDGRMCSHFWWCLWVLLDFPGINRHVFLSCYTLSLWICSCLSLSLSLCLSCSCLCGFSRDSLSTDFNPSLLPQTWTVRLAIEFYKKNVSSL